MLKKFSLIFLAVFALFFLLGCTQTSICGDTICQAGEENTCPTDCAKPINSNVIVNVSGAYDTQGELWLEYYNNSNVYANINKNITSILGEHWQGNTNNNLSVSFNQSSYVQLPVPNNRQIIISNLKQGEYIFTVRSEDYGYFAKSETVLINEDRDYYVNLDLKANQPMLRVKALDEQGNVLNGSGLVTVIEVVNYFDKYGSGNWETKEREVSSVWFDSSSEMNALFSLWAPTNDLEYNTHFKVVVNKDNYGSSVLDYAWVGNKYQEYHMNVIQEKPKTGNLKIQIIPGVGTTKDDLKNLVGKKVSICPTKTNGTCELIGVSQSLTVLLENYNYGQYSIQYSGPYDKNTVPISIQYAAVLVDSEAGHANAVALKGTMLNLFVRDSFENIIDSSKIKVHTVCQENFSGDNVVQCNDLNGRLWSEAMGSNPYVSQYVFYSENDVNLMTQGKIIMYLSYLEIEKKFTFTPWKQGLNNVNLMFDKTCVDTDGGLDYYVKGTATGININGVFEKQVDECWGIEGNELSESSCTKDGILAIRETPNCKYGCLDGACLKSIPKCYDSDPKGDLYTKGYVQLNDSNTRLYDQCGSAQGYGGNLILQSYCGQNGRPEVDYNTSCPGKCLDGVCVKLTPEEEARAKWSDTTPFVIVDWYRNKSEIKVVLKNVSKTTLNFVDMNLSLTDRNTTKSTSVASGKTITKTFKRSCTAAGTEYNFGMKNIAIRYADSKTPSKVLIQKGVADILGKCDEAFSKIPFNKWLQGRGCADACNDGKNGNHKCCSGTNYVSCEDKDDMFGSGLYNNGYRITLVEPISSKCI